MKKKNIIITIAVIAVIVGANIASQNYFYRFDLTSEGRYTLADNTKELLRNTDNELQIVVYLDGEMNSGFLRLKRATVEMLDEFRVYAGKKLTYSFVNPSLAATNKERFANYERLERQGLRATIVHDKDGEGQTVQKALFPWAQIIYQNPETGRTDTANVSLLKNIQGNDGTQNLNISIENLEFELTDAIRTLTIHETQKIALLEGHRELPEILTYDITQALSHYFQIDRGTLGSDPNILSGYKAVVVAKPLAKFSESDKYILDHYIMNGGRVLWLVDGARVSMDTLAAYGMSPAIPNDINLNDQLFRYGVRINADMVMDAQCSVIPVDQAREGDAHDYQPMAWYYAPLLLASPYNVVTKNINVVRGEFASSIDFVGNDKNIDKEVLLATSPHSRAIATPTRIGMEALELTADPHFFNQQYLPVAVALSGKFPSVFAGRLPPKEIVNAGTPKTESADTRMIVVANGDVIRNDVSGSGYNLRPLPLGFDKYTNQTFGNRDFILNAILYLTDDEGWLALRSREIKLRLLDKVAVNENKKLLQTVNVGLPVIVLMLFAVGNVIVRRRKYAK
ncbi:MAG: gliding motility-associated ABC transporter substrate-binding protein GldG [Prevotellaceae bacterium]|jgi:ABC-2 type transport system permease protein|nr:gliding motility-associated ABC transporter substrate-binding protein GldG [Prevotellaceae bacterium]